MGAATGTALLTWIGITYFSDNMSDIRKGSYNVAANVKRSGVAPVERKGSVQAAESYLGKDTTFDFTD